MKVRLLGVLALLFLMNTRALVAKAPDLEPVDININALEEGGSVGDRCNYSFPSGPKCKPGLTCITSGVPGAYGTCGYADDSSVGLPPGARCRISEYIPNPCRLPYHCTSKGPRDRGNETCQLVSPPTVPMIPPLPARP